MSLERVVGIHLVDMIVHRWDLAAATGRTLVVPESLLEVALPIARVITLPGSPLNGPGGVYNPPLPDEQEQAPMEALLRLLGRDPRWAATQLVSARLPSSS
ncbi:hypothetical protein [Antrihabitans cavernicola]|uniref:TIGR03086 family protein n=1 Tax=Antrihabitans cavernicola TaxID=2495913 RepID=A0A5A7S6U8_9NOCA|nr:hypothetical protein [Spelaeibacter cavernicola]KAA0019394.1 hypothetical protein FOY51_22350 [Spelaeibacter cavernicola]